MEKVKEFYIGSHLVNKGFVEDYNVWKFHDESNKVLVCHDAGDVHEVAHEGGSSLDHDMVDDNNLG